MIHYIVNDKTKEKEGIVVNKIKDITNKLGWKFIGPSSNEADVYNKVDWLYEKDGEPFGVQIKIASKEYESSNDLRMTEREYNALKEHENTSRYQLQVIIDTSYEDLNENSNILKVIILDYKVMYELLPKLNLDFSSTDLLHGIEDKKHVRWGNYSSFHNKEGWYLQPNNIFPYYRFKNWGGFITIPYSFTFNNKNLCEILYNKGEENGK